MTEKRLTTIQDATRKYGPVGHNPVNLQVTLGGETVQLTFGPARLLQSLLKNSTPIVPRAVLQETADIKSSCLHFHLASLRQALKPLGMGVERVREKNGQTAYRLKLPNT